MTPVATMALVGQWASLVYSGPLVYNPEFLIVKASRIRDVLSQYRPEPEVKAARIRTIVQQVRALSIQPRARRRKAVST